MGIAEISLGGRVISLLATLMLVVQLLMVIQRMLLTNVRLFALQSLFLAGIAATVAFFNRASHVYLVAGLIVVLKVVLLPWFLERLVKRVFGEAPTELSEMAGGASTRQFQRVVMGDRTAVAMYVPLPSQEVTKANEQGRRWPFLEVRDLLATRGRSARGPARPSSVVAARGRRDRRRRWPLAA